MNLIDSLKQKAEAERAKGEAEWFPLAEKVANGTAAEKDIAAVLKATGRTLDDLQIAVDRVHEIERLKALAGLFRERSLAQNRHTLETAKHRAFSIVTCRDLEHTTNHLRALGWQVGREASESQEAFRTLAELTGTPFKLPNLAEDFRALDAEFAADVVADAGTVPVVTVGEVELPSM